MADFTVRSDHIDVEQIMRQIRARIRDKRGADYTEAEIRELANVKLDKFLDPRAVRSDLLLHYRQQRRPANEAPMPLYAFDPSIVYVSDRGTPGRILTFIRKLLNPILKLFFNPSPLLHVMHLQTQINDRVNKALVTREEFDALNFEMFNNLVVELTRLGIEVRNLRMQVESFGTRLDFDERRARALEGAVQYKPGAPVARPPQPSASQLAAAAPGQTGQAGGDEGDEEEGVDGETGRARRRRRRRGRRRGQGGQAEGAAFTPDQPHASASSSTGQAPGATAHEQHWEAETSDAGTSTAGMTEQVSAARNWQTGAADTSAAEPAREAAPPAPQAHDAWGGRAASHENFSTSADAPATAGASAPDAEPADEQARREAEHEAFWQRIAERSTFASSASESAGAPRPEQPETAEPSAPEAAPAADARESASRSETESARRFTRVYDDEAPAPAGAADAFTTGGADAPADEAATGGTESATGDTAKPGDSESSRS